MIIMSKFVFLNARDRTAHVRTDSREVTERFSLSAQNHTPENFHEAAGKLSRASHYHESISAQIDSSQEMLGNATKAFLVGAVACELLGGKRIVTATLALGGIASGITANVLGIIGDQNRIAADELAGMASEYYGKSNRA